MCSDCISGAGFLPVFRINVFLRAFQAHVFCPFFGQKFAACFQADGKTHGNLQKQADVAVQMKNLPFYRVKML